MAPQTMFAKIRNHHRRSSLTPSSPQNAQSTEPPDHSTQHFPPSSDTTSPRLDSPVSVLPPILPPIPRVASKHEAQREESEASQPGPQNENTENRKPLADSFLVIDFDLRELPLPPSIQRVDSQEENIPSQHTTHLSRPPQAPPKQHEERVPDPPRLMQSIPSSKAPATLSRTSNSFAEFSSSFMRNAKPRTGSHQPSTAPPSGARSHFPDNVRPGSEQRVPTPSSSISSLQKAASSTNLAADASPASSRSGQGSMSNAVPSRSSKSRLNMLNPVSLLMRRRTSRAFEDSSDGHIVPHRMMDVPAMDLPSNYDPRIRGKGVHNFDDSSRTQRNSSATDTIDLDGSSPGSRVQYDSRSPAGHKSGKSDGIGRDPSPEKEHTPIFVENFDDDDLGAATGATPVQRESLANQDFLSRMSRQLDFDSIDFSVPAGPKRSSGDPNNSAPKHTSTAARSSKTTDSSSVRHSSDQSTVRSSISNETRATSAPPSPSHAPTTQSATLEPPFQAVPTLQHLSSTASRNSRFSFQLNSDHCIEQERALEDKHKQKQALKASKHVSVTDSRFDELADEEVDIDYDDLGEGGYQEEAIPGVNASDEEEPVGLNNQRLSTFGPAMTSTRASSQSMCTGINEGQESPPKAQGAMYQHQNTDLNRHIHSQQDQDQDHSSSDRTMTKSTIASDDMYFDDGMIDAPTQSGQSHYDESMFDSPMDGQFKYQALGHNPPSVQCHTPGLVGLGLHKEDESTFDSDQDSRLEAHSGHDRESDETSNEPQKREVEAASLHKPSSLTAYHSALASAASRAAKSGKFDRQGSVATASSRYSDDQEDSSGFVNEDWGDDDGAQDFDDDGEDEDPMIAAANAEVLASEDADFYGQEFGFYGNASGPKGEAYNGGYFGQQNMLGASLHNRKNDPNLTPITERSEYSTRNSWIGSTPWGPPSMGGREPPAMSPGLKDIAAGMGLDDEDMTLGQLLRLRKVAFEGSGPQSAQDSSNSKDSSPTSATNSAALPFRMSPMMSAGGYGSVYDHQRRPSELELADVREAPEDEENADTPISGMDSPSSPTVTIATATAVAVPQAVGQVKRKSSAEVYAQEYSDAVSGSPHAPSNLSELPIEPPSSSTGALKAPAVPGRGSPPLLRSPPLPKSPGRKPGLVNTTPLQPPIRSAPPTATSFSAMSSSPLSTSALPRTTSSSPIPSPSITMMQKFASRPPPDAYRKTWEPSQRMSSSLGGQSTRPGNGNSGGSVPPSAGSVVAGTTSVAYVREFGEDGREQWYLERRRKQSNGDLVVIGRELVQGGSI